jgi:hypothetical protein
MQLRYQGRLRTQLAIGYHRVDDGYSTVASRIKICQGIILARRVDHAREHGGLRNTQGGEVFAEVELCRGRKSDGSGTQIDVVEIAGQNLVLCQMMLKPDCDRRFLDFARIGALRVEKKDFDQLLRNCAAAGDKLPSFDILYQCA